jgi:hypothetical protein
VQKYHKDKPDFEEMCEVKSLTALKQLIEGV